MVINDRLKGEFYRAPITKLASRRNIENYIKELEDYYVNLSEKLDVCFNDVTKYKDIVYSKLLNIYERTLHFKYIIENFELEVDQHIAERLNCAINGFTNKFIEITTPYKANLFNHNSSDDDLEATNYNVDEWDRSINSLSSDLGIRWYSGKLDNDTFINNLNGILKISKLNTTKDKPYENYIKSNLILEFFIYVKSKILWIAMAQNNSLGYNYILKYKSPNLKLNISLPSETHNVRKDSQINTFDFNVIIDTLLTSNDLKSSDIYIKIKTNIPANSESGRDNYIIGNSETFDDYNYDLQSSNFNKGLLYHDNTDVLCKKSPGDTFKEIYEKTAITDDDETWNIPNVDTRMLLNSKSSYNKYGMQYSSDRFISKFNIDSINIDQSIVKYNKSIGEVSMYDIPDEMNGIFVKNTIVDSTKTLPDITFNKNGDVDPSYYKKEQLVDINNNYHIDASDIITKNAIGFKIDNIDSNNDVLYGKNAFKGTVKNIIVNEITNNSDLNILDDDSEIEETPNVIIGSASTGAVSTSGPTVAIDPYKIYCVYKPTNKDYLLLSTSVGLYKILPNLTSVQISLNNLATKVYDIIENKNNYILLATDNGILTYTNEIVSVYGTSGTGIQSGSWSKFFKLGTDSNYRVVAIRDDFYTTGLSYGESMCIENNSSVTLFKSFYNSSPIEDESLITFSSSEIADEFTSTSKNDTPSKHFTVLNDSTSNRYFIFSYGHRMMKSDNNEIAGQTGLYSFANIDFVYGMKDYNVYSAVLKNNKIYFTGSKISESENVVKDYVYDLSRESITVNEPYTYLNSHKVDNRIYYLNDLDTLKSSEEPAAEIKFNYSVKKINNKIFMVPLSRTEESRLSLDSNSNSEFCDIEYVNGIYYVLDNDGCIWCLDKDFNIIKRIYYIYNTDISELVSLENILLINDSTFIGTDINSIKYFNTYNYLNLDDTNSLKIIHTESI